MNELENAVNKTSLKDLEKLCKNYPLTKEMISELNKELDSKIKRETFKREYERRRLLKLKKNDN